MLRKINDFSYDETNGLVVKKIEEHQLTKIQRKLFNYFIQNPKVTISKQVLMDEVWERTVTENSIEKTLSKLRNVIEEDPNNPKILITHFGHGISFEGNIQEALTETSEKQLQESSSKKIFYLIPILLIAIALIGWLMFPKIVEPKIRVIQNLSKEQRLLILPVAFENQDEEQNGIYGLIKSTFNNLDSEGQVVFDESVKSSKEIMEKHWKIDQDLVMMHTNVKKNGEVYDAIMELTNGLNLIKTVKISASNLPELAHAQIRFVADFHQGIHAENLTTPKQTFLKAQSLFDNKNFLKAKELLEQLIKSNDKDYSARFLYAHTLFWLLDYKKSLVQLAVLKQTPYYKNNGASVEILTADIKMALGENVQIIADLTSFLSSHLKIGQLKKSKIMIQLANANSVIGKNKDALKFFKQAIINLDEKYNPKIYALSYFGQARMANNISINTDVYKLYEKALYYAKLNNNIQYQATILDAMSAVLFYNNQWKKGLKLKRESIALVEIIDDKSESLGSGLGVLASYLIERGLYTEARTVVDRIGSIAREIKSDHLTLIFYHYDVSIELMLLNYDYCEDEIKKGYELATTTNNLGMLLNNVFLQMELLLARKDTLNFKAKWDERNQLFVQPGLDRYQIYMDLYLARYYKEIGDKDNTVALISKVSELAKQTGDMKFLTDAQNTLAQLYLKDNPEMALEILNAIEQYNPNPNPYLEIKAEALNLLGRNIEALTLITEAKAAYNEAWNPENQALLELLQSQLN